jgi:hypothetical protein
MSIVFDTPLAEYVTPEEHRRHAEVAKLVAEYHEAKAMAIEHRLAGDRQHTDAWDKEVDRLATQIEEQT